MTPNADSPRVSVIIPAFNAEPYIRETLDSVLAQTYSNVEVIVVDDGSTDRTREVVRTFGDRVTYLHQPNSGGCGKPRNEGMKIASGELFVFLDSDDLMVPNRIATEVAVLHRHPELGMVFSNYRDFEGEQMYDGSHFECCRLLSQRLRAQPEPTILLPDESTELLLTENFGSSSPMIRREVVRRVGGFDETLRASEDYDFQCRVASTYAIGLVPSVGWHKRLHPASMSSNLPNILFHKILTRSRLLERETVPRRRRKLRRMLASYYFSLAYHHAGRDNALALRNALVLLRFQPVAVPRLLARIALDLLGRDTTGARRMTSPA